MRQQVALATSSDALVALTTTEARFYQERGQAPANVKVISPGIDTEELGGGDGDRFRHEQGLDGPVILSIGAMSREKGTIQLVEAVRRLWAAGRRIELVLIGEVLSPFQKYLKSLPAAERQRIRLLGPVPDTVKRDALAAASIFSMTSITESFGMVYLEAWLYGKPVIGANVWAVKDVITHGEDGLLVPFGDVGALAQALSTLLDNPETARDLGLNGRQKVLNQHTWSLQFQVIHDLYNSLT
jgi:glycogen(starch) synthase